MSEDFIKALCDCYHKDQSIVSIVGDGLCIDIGGGVKVDVELGERTEMSVTYQWAWFKQGDVYLGDGYGDWWHDIHRDLLEHKRKRAIAVIMQKAQELIKEKVEGVEVCSEF